MKKVKVLVIELLLGGNSIFKFNEEIEVGGPLLSKEKAEELVKDGYVEEVLEKEQDYKEKAEEKKQTKK